MGAAPWGMGGGRWERRGNRRVSHPSQIMTRTGCTYSGRGCSTWRWWSMKCPGHSVDKKGIFLQLRRHHMRPLSFVATIPSSGDFPCLSIIIFHNHFAPCEPIRTIGFPHEAWWLYWNLSNVKVNHDQMIDDLLLHFIAREIPFSHQETCSKSAT